MRIPFSKLLPALLVMVACPLLQAQDTRAYYGDKEQGWFWYQDPAPPPEMPAPQPAPEAKPTKPEGPAPFSVAWLRENMDQLRDDAIENFDDKDKVRAYLYAVRVMMDKAQNFADSAHDIANTDPLLDNNNRIPLGSASKSAMLQLQAGAKTEIIRFLSERVGIWFFYDGKCSFCRSQVPLLNQFKQLHPEFRVRNVSMDGSRLPGLTGETRRDQGQAKRIGLKITPTMVLVMPSATFSIVSQGLITSSELEDKIILAARTANMIPEDLLAQYQVHRRGVLTGKDFKDGEAQQLDMKDPAQWIRYLQEKLQGRY